MAATKPKTDATARTYDPAKRYSVRLARVIDFEGFTLKPGPNPIEMTGAWANDHADAIEEAQELPEPAPLPEPASEVHEIADR